MTDEERASHERFAKQTFNRCWDLIDQSDRSVDDDVEMLLAAMTSRWHWAQIGGSEQIATGDWQVGHVAALLGHGELARTFAARNLAAADSLGWSGWRLASAHEGMARACAAAGDAGGRAQHVAVAEQALEGEPDPDDAQIVIDQLASIPPA